MINQFIQFISIVLMAIATMAFTMSYFAIVDNITSTLKAKGLIVCTNILAIFILLILMIMFFVYILGI